MPLGLGLAVSYDIVAVVATAERVIVVRGPIVLVRYRHVDRLVCADDADGADGHEALPIRNDYITRQS